MASILTKFARLIPALVLTSLAIAMQADAATNKTLFDFQATTNSPAWEVVNDDVMGGVSTSQFQVLTNGCAVFSGTVRLENNGGFASVRSAPLHEDLTDFAAFVLRVRGDGRRYKLSVRTGAGFDSPLYQCSFTTKTGEWEEHRLAFGDFVPTLRGRVLTDVPPLNPARVNSVGLLISDKQVGPFRLEIGWIKASPPVKPWLGNPHEDGDSSR
jgi:NADH dehydrogenase [ubiquinone] 1 alpha subcomplex assembly factor 1